MSSRLLKKFLKEKTRDEIKTLGELVEEEEAVTVRPKKKSVFAYLDDSEGSDGSTPSQPDGEAEKGKGKVAQSGAKEKQSQNGPKEKQSQNGIKEKQSPNGGNGAPPPRSSKKKKKKKKNLDEEIDDILHTINAETKQKTEGHPNGKDSDEEAQEGGDDPSQMNLPELSACTHEKYDYCLKLEKGNFDVNIELKRIFGKDFVKEKKFIQKSKIKYIKNWLIQDYSTKIVHPPMSMKKYGNEFKLEKYKLYLEAENLFYVLLDTHDIEAMHNLLKKFPFHVDTLLVLSEYYNESNNFEVANKFTKLSLLLLQHVFHIDFHPNNLNKQRQIFVNPYLYDNKALFKALYMHMMSLENEACTITALEVAKLLCKIDLQFDLCSILLRIDSLILKCNLFDFLIYFSFNFVIQNVQCVVPPARLSQIIATSFPSAQDNPFHDEMKFPEIHPPKWDQDLWKRQSAQYYIDQEGNVHTGIAPEPGATTTAAVQAAPAEGAEPSGHANQLINRYTEEECASPTTEQRTDELKKMNNEKREPPNDTYSNDEPLYRLKSEDGSELSVGPEQHSVGQPDEKDEQDKDDPQEGACKGDERIEDERVENTLQSKLLFDNFEIRLHFILPNFAFSLPLSMYLKNNNFVDHQEIRLISVNDLVSAFTYEECRFLSPHCAIRFDCHGDSKAGRHDQSGHAQPDQSPHQPKKEQPSLSFSAHVTLLRALLCFPNFLQTFLNYNNFKTTKVVKKTIYETSFQDILASPPFSSPSLFRLGENETVQKIISCYLEKNNIYYKSEKIITWFHVCSAFLHDMYRDPSAAQALDKARAQWHSKIPLLDINKYKDVRVGEFKSSNYLLPDFMMEKNRTYSPHIPTTPSNYYVSLNSNLIIAFFQSLLPWYQVDYYGTHSRPVYFSTLIQNVVNETKRLFNFQ
ncbi:Uncharacterized protein PCOAH_00031080 [Plasmodium coatneyi]|uniref:Transcription factor 25 n=1 Tax=Plasmodium coatneyi TaxID=208452 RepID=A0A1B1E0M7_9APIC|nr:Uncharacterized protein PCOAH_00031080 [Plasmodium coatneyi]ANQ08568.1 Uncharacterized protein PCOAH_00031080 [Plasmodium coatneyi]